MSPQQPKADIFQVPLRADRNDAGPASSDLMEVGLLDFHRHRAPGIAAAVACGPNFGCEQLNGRHNLLPAFDITLEGGLGT